MYLNTLSIITTFYTTTSLFLCVYVCNDPIACKLQWWKRLFNLNLPLSNFHCGSVLENDSLKRVGILDWDFIFAPKENREAIAAALEQSKEEYAQINLKKDSSLEELNKVKEQQAGKLVEIQATVQELKNTLTLEIHRYDLAIIWSIFYVLSIDWQRSLQLFNELTVSLWLITFKGQGTWA